MSINAIRIVKASPETERLMSGIVKGRQQFDPIYRIKYLKPDGVLAQASAEKLTLNGASAQASTEKLAPKDTSAQASAEKVGFFGKIKNVVTGAIKKVKDFFAGILEKFTNLFKKETPETPEAAAAPEAPVTPAAPAAPAAPATPATPAAPATPATPAAPAATSLDELIKTTEKTADGYKLQSGDTVPYAQYREMIDSFKKAE